MAAPRSSTPLPTRPLTLGQLLKQTRLMRGLNRLQVCREVKITPPTLDAYEADKRPPKAATLWHLAFMYGLDCNDLAEQAHEAKAAQARRKFDQGSAPTCDHV